MMEGNTLILSGVGLVVALIEFVKVVVPTISKRVLHVVVFVTGLGVAALESVTPEIAKSVNIGTTTLESASAGLVVMYGIGLGALASGGVTVAKKFAERRAA